MQARTARTTRGVAALTRITSNEVGSNGVGARSTSGGVGGGTSAAGAGGTATGAMGAIFCVPERRVMNAAKNRLNCTCLNRNDRVHRIRRNVHRTHRSRTGRRRRRRR